jgi:hypothetical protein
MRPAIPTVRYDAGNESVIVTAYNDGDNDETFDVNVYYFNDTLSAQLIGTIEFQLNTPSAGASNSTEIAIDWDISVVDEGAYWLKANTTGGAGGDDNLADNEMVSTEQTGIIRGHNVGMSMVRGSFPPQRRAGRDLYTITLDAYNNGFYDESFTVTTYYNRSGDPTNFVSINVTTITNMVKKTGALSWNVVWNSSGLPEDTYTVSANASVVSGENLDLDQDYFGDSVVEIIEHDIALLDVVASPTGVNSGETVQVNATVQNQGVWTDWCNVTIYANGSAIGPQQDVSLVALDDRFKIDYKVSPSAAWKSLRGWTDGYTDVSLRTSTWKDKSEPNDGSWSWTDVSNLVVKFGSDVVGVVDDREIRIYEVYATIYRPSGQFVSNATAHSISGLSVTNPSNAYDGDASSYASFLTNADGSIEFATFTTSTDTITRVDINIQYSAVEVTKILTFNWDTTSWPTGWYKINGTANIVPGETLETADNDYDNPAIQRRVNIPPVHDVAVVFAYVNQTYAKPGDQIAIYATIQNQGDADETPTVTPYYRNDTFSAPAAASQPVTVADRAHTGQAYKEEDLTFVWDTTGIPLGTYSITVNASAVAGETDTGDNNYARADFRVIFTRLYIDPYKTMFDASGLSNVYQSYPTTHAETAVTNPLNAYDGNNATYASFLTDTDHYFYLETFTTPSAEPIGRVDLKVRYSAAAVSLPTEGLDDRYRISQTVSPSSSWAVLQDWSTSNEEIYPAEYFVWDNQPEPNDGSWSWTDVSNLIIRFDSDLVGLDDGNRYVRIYEAWARVNTTTGLYESRPTANTFSGISVSNPANAYDGDDDTYAQFRNDLDGYLEFTTFTIDAGSIIDVDILIKYRAWAASSDRFRIQKTVAPLSAYSTVQDYITSDVDWPLDTYTYTHILEPNDGNWSWTDVSNLIVQFRSDNRYYPEGREVRVYEVWATVYTKTFTVDLNVGGVQDVKTWSVRVSWDPDILDLVEVEKKEFLTDPGDPEFDTIFTPSINHTGGYADISEAIIGLRPGISGSGSLANLTFISFQEGKSPIALSETVLLDSSGNSMEHFAESGKFNTIPLVGDLDSDYDVDAADLFILTQAYGSELGDANWNAVADLNGDLIVDAKDLRLLCHNWW